MGKNMDYSDKLARGDILHERVSLHNNFTLRMSALPRLFPSILKLNNIGYQNINYCSSGVFHKSIDFCLVLSSESGKYIYSIDGKKKEYTPPLIFIKGPGNAYGNHTSSLREVFYFSYSAKAKLHFTNMNLKPGYPGIEILKNSPIIKLALEIISKSDLIYEVGMADKLEKLCEMILIEASLLNKQVRCAPVHDDNKIAEIVSYFDANYKKKINIADLIKKHGFSKRSFYRVWKKKYSISPIDYLESLKMSQASSLLFNSHKQISEIANELNYEDPMYFSRRFTKYFKLSPREYRKQSENL